MKGVLLEGSRVVLLENERAEWELPGGRPEPGESPEACLIREIAEELGAEVAVEGLLDSWIYEVLPGRRVRIVTYGLRRLDSGPLRISGEHRRLGHFASERLALSPCRKAIGARSEAGSPCTARQVRELAGPRDPD